MPAADFFMPPDEMLAKRAAAVRRLLPEHLLRAAGVALPKTPSETSRLMRRAAASSQVSLNAIKSP